ncbi:hypothetical protein [Rhodanobacter sp. MP1X3]|uniref:hypothetical protein n=1 Tax=Rhodanobacter sp. MP1X3 TaxID=2723086 RepID=UPI00161E2B29|nr:hypothetical protein [Rhodanobacter sp. MP1X3]MBB6244727.1 hypothetical protein [Rhodanobacter sp. MP1X3]
MKAMQRIRHYKSDIALLLLAVVTAVVMLKTSDDPLIPQLQHSLLGDWLTQLPTGNQTVFNLSAGVVSAVFTYFLFVRLPEERKRRRVLAHLAGTFRDTKINLIRAYLSMVGRSYDAGLPEELLNQGAFRSFFGDDTASGDSRWYGVANGLNEYWLKEIAAELEILHNELQFALAAIEPRYTTGYSRLKSVAAWTLRSRNIDLTSDDSKPFLRALWQLHTGFNFVDGYTGRDIIADEIQSL